MARKTKGTTFLIEANDAMKLENVAKKLALTRNDIIKLIVRGVLNNLLPIQRQK